MRGPSSGRHLPSQYDGVNGYFAEGLVVPHSPGPRRLGGMSSCEETWVPATTETNCLPAKLGPLAPRRVSPAP